MWLLSASKDETGFLQITLLDQEIIIPFQSKINGTKISQEEVVQFTISFSENNLSNSLWWPRGYGNQQRYELIVSFTNSNNQTNSNPFETKQKISQMIGFREMKVIENSLLENNQIGKDFYFQVNGIPIFAKGANWIPVDAFESRVTDQRIYELVQSAFDANMNTLRNWGGGIYQHNYFYELCDEKGIMVWEEFMFACGCYPRDSDFLNNVKNEVRHQVLRLMYHPSLIIWSGNNENELALGSGSSVGWYYETKLNPYRYVVDYNYLNTDTVYSTLRNYEKIRTWIPSSPSNGILETDPYVERWGNPASEYWGDVHYYNYYDLCTNTSIYPKPRFASEYGFQSYPNLKLLSTVSEPSDWAVFSEFLVHRQHHPDGNIQLDNQISMLFNYPNSTDSDKKFSDWLYLTQCVQALCLRVESEHYRRLKSSEAHTMGTIYWQLNSIWPAPTWSSLEYGNHWKLAHYYTTDFFAETIISSYQDLNTNNYFVYVTTDSMNSQNNGNYSISAYRWVDGKQVGFWSGITSISPLSSVLVFQNNLNSMLNSIPHNEVYFVLEWTVNSTVVADNSFFLTSFNEIRLPAVSFNITVLNVADRTASIQLFASASAPYCFVETLISGRFSRNGFLLRPNVPVTFSFFGTEDFTALELEKSLIVRSIRDTYQ